MRNRVDANDRNPGEIADLAGRCPEGVLRSPRRGRRAVAEAVERFREACELLKELSANGYSVYLASDTMHLMVGPSHDERERPLQGNSIANVIVPGSGGGDW